MIRKWWNKKSAKEKWKIKAGVAWFVGGFAILIAITLPTINAFLEQVSPTELAELNAYLENFLFNQIMWTFGLILVTIVISMVVICCCGKNSMEDGQKP